MSAAKTRLGNPAPYTQKEVNLKGPYVERQREPLSRIPEETIGELAERPPIMIDEAYKATAW